jgi:hypothetical protein
MPPPSPPLRSHHAGHVLHSLGYHQFAHGAFMEAMGNPWVSGALGAFALLGPGRRWGAEAGRRAQLRAVAWVEDCFMPRFSSGRACRCPRARRSSPCQVPSCRDAGSRFVAAGRWLRPEEALVNPPCPTPLPPPPPLRPSRHAPPLPATRTSTSTPPPRLILDGFKALWLGNPNMNSLVGVGSTASFTVGAASAMVPSLGFDSGFLEEPVMLLAFVLLGGRAGRAGVGGGGW